MEPRRRWRLGWHFPFAPSPSRQRKRLLAWLPSLLGCELTQGPLRLWLQARHGWQLKEPVLGSRFQFRPGSLLRAQLASALGIENGNSSSVTILRKFRGKTEPKRPGASGLDRLIKLPCSRQNRKLFSRGLGCIYVSAKQMPELTPCTLHYKCT